MNKRCLPGDLARVIYSFYPELIDRTVFVEGFSEARNEWAVCLLGEPVRAYLDPDKPTTNAWWFRDQSLLPLRGEAPESTQDEVVETEGCNHD